MPLKYGYLNAIFALLLLGLFSCKKDSPAVYQTDADVTSIKLSSTRVSANENVSSGSQVMYTYNNHHGLLSSATTYSGADSLFNSTATFNYSNNRLSTKTFTTRGSSPSYYYFYNTAGQLTTIQVLYGLYHPVADGTLIPADKITQQYNFTYNTTGKVKRIEVARYFAGAPNLEPERWYYDHEYNIKDELATLIFYKKDDPSTGRKYEFTKYAAGTIELNPEVLDFLNYPVPSHLSIALTHKLPLQITEHWTTDINSPVVGKFAFDYNIVNKRLQSVKKTYQYYFFTNGELIATTTDNFDIGY